MGTSPSNAGTSVASGFEEARVEGYESPSESTLIYGVDREGKAVTRAEYYTDDPSVDWDLCSTDGVQFELDLFSVFKLFEPGVPFDSAKAKRFRPSDAELSEVTSIGELVDALGRHIQIAHEAHQRADAAEAQWWESIRQWAEALSLHPSNLRRWLSQLAEEAGIEGTVTPRSMRTAAGSLLSHDGIALERIADLLGHRDIRTLQAHYRRPVAPSVDTATDYWKVANDPEKESFEIVNGGGRKRVGSS